MTNLPPQAPPFFAYSPESLINRTEQLIASNKELTDAIAQRVQVENATFSNVLLPLQQAKDAMTLELYPIGFLRSVSTSTKVRNAAASAERKISDYKIEVSMREDIFKLVEAVYSKQKNGPALDAESRHLLEKEYKAYVRTGFALAPEKRNHLEKINKRLPELYMEFSQNLSEENGGLWLTLAELHGVPPDTLKMWERGQEGGENEGKLKIPFKYPSMIPIRKYCTVAETRKKVFLGNENKCNQNIYLLKEALALRDEAARLLGYADHATFVLEDKMAKTPQAVLGFLDDLRKNLADGAEKELDSLKKLKHADTGDAEHYYLWDHLYYDTMMKSQYFQLDQNSVSEYFPLQACVKSMINIFEELFGLVFVKMEGSDRDSIAETGRGDDVVWHADVELFSVWDDTTQQDGTNFVGYIYFDLLPREGKYRGASNFTLHPGFSGKGDRQHYPATALVCNFTTPTDKKPSLLSHSQVQTMFHELGHGIHNLVSQTTYGCFHGTYTTRDFVEAPSKMLEHWCWAPSQIKALSRHWSYLSPEYAKAYMEGASGPAAARPEENMPDAMIQSIIRTRNVNEALSQLSQVHFALFDMTIHQPKSHEESLNMNVSGLYSKIRHDVSMLDDLGDGEQHNGAALMSHVMAGYDAVVYVYLWSEVYAADMFRTAFGKNPMDKEAGRRYRRIVLKPGGSREPMGLLKEFLGREPSIQAFYKELGIV